MPWSFPEGEEEIISEIREEELDMEKLQNMPGIVCYLVQPGDTLWDIAKRFLYHHRGNTEAERSEERDAAAHGFPSVSEESRALTKASEVDSIIIVYKKHSGENYEITRDGKDKPGSGCAPETG